MSEAVEQISQALQGLSITSSASESIDPTPDTSMVLQAPTADIEVPSTFRHALCFEVRRPALLDTHAARSGTGWGSVGDSLVHGGEDDAVSDLVSVREDVSLTLQLSSTLSLF
jgi:hypothetical protein